jgi:hypothetical protein
MFQSSWISVFGLAIEVIGLAFLFRDLLRSKTVAGSMAEFSELQDELEISNRELVLRTHSGFQTLLRFLRGYLALLEIEAREAAQAADASELRSRDPELAKLVEFVRGQGPVGLRRHAVEKFASAASDLLSTADVESALTVNNATRSALAKRYAEQVAEAESLRHVARIGVAFVAAGASLQFVDLLF